MRYSNRQLAEALLDIVEISKDIEKAAETFVKFLLNENQARRLPDVIFALERVWKDRFGAATITIQSAHTLNVVIRKKILQHSSGAEIHECINKDLIGGARVRVDDRVIDGSILGYLDQLKSSLLNS